MVAPALRRKRFVLSRQKNAVSFSEAAFLFERAAGCVYGFLLGFWNFFFRHFPARQTGPRITGRVICPFDPDRRLPLSFFTGKFNRFSGRMVAQVSRRKSLISQKQKNAVSFSEAAFLFERAAGFAYGCFKIFLAVKIYNSLSTRRAAKLSAKRRCAFPRNFGSAVQFSLMASSPERP